MRAAGLRLLMATAMAGRTLPEVLEMLDAPRPVSHGEGDERLVRALRRWPTTCLYRSLAGYAQLRAQGEGVRL